MRELTLQDHILLTFQKNRSKHLKKSISLAKKADHFTEKDDQIGCKYTRTPDSLGRLYYLLRALYHSHRFRTVEVGIDGHVLIEKEIHELWNTLSCFIESRRFKNTRNHCDCIHDPQAGALTIGSFKERTVTLVPCRRAFFGRPSSPHFSKEQFMDVSDSVFATICPLFDSNLYRKLRINAEGEKIEIETPQIEKKTKLVLPPSRKE